MCCFDLFYTYGKRLVKKYRGVGSEQRGGGSSVFEPLVRGGSFNFQLSLRDGSSCFFMGIGTHLTTKEDKGGKQITLHCIKKCPGTSGSKSLGSSEFAVKVLPFKTRSTSVSSVYKTTSVTTCAPKIAFRTFRTILEAVGG